MDQDTLDRIAGYACIINDTISSDEPLLNFVVADVVDRAIAYMNRQRFQEAWDLALEAGLTPEDDDWDDISRPLPLQLERALANVAIGVRKTLQQNKTSDVGAVHSVSDNGQSITYGDKVANYLASSADSDLFSGTIELLNKFRVPTTIEITRRFHN